jgi:mannose-6-phosphate isomerase-like protein (cupin superfamily)
MQKISEEEARLYGIETKYDLMDNGERKFRLNCSTDGSSYCRTVASETGAWQNSHFHKSVSEYYVVQSGGIVYAEKNGGEFKLRLLMEGESVSFSSKFRNHSLYITV